MRKRCILLLLTLGLLWLGLFLGADYGTAALGRHLLRGRLVDLLSGDCSLVDTPSVRLARSLRSPTDSRPPSVVPKELNGLRLSVRVSPFNLERNENTVTFTEMGPWVLHVEVDDDVWIMQEPERSSTTVEQPIHNANLLGVLAPMVVEDIAPGIFEDSFQLFPVTFHNMSILERVADAWEKTEVIMNLYNYTVEGNTLRQVHSFLSRGNGSALVYDGSSFHVAERNISARPGRVRSLPPLALVPNQYHLPGLRDLTWEYWRSGESAVAGASVSQYKVKDIWEPDLLCRFSNHILYNIRKRVRDYGVFLAPPQSLQSQNFIIKWSGDAPFSAVLDVYSPFGVPVGASLAVQVNIHIPRNASDDILPGEITPVARVTVQVERLPEGVMVWLVRAMYLRTGILLLLLLLLLAGLTAALLVDGTVALVRWRRRRSITLTKVHHDPL